MNPPNEIELTQYPDFIDAVPGLDPDTFDLKSMHALDAEFAQIYSEFDWGKFSDLVYTIVK